MADYFNITFVHYQSLPVPTELKELAVKAVCHEIARGGSPPFYVYLDSKNECQIVTAEDATIVIKR